MEPARGPERLTAAGDGEWDDAEGIRLAAAATGTEDALVSLDGAVAAGKAASVCTETSAAAGAAPTSNAAAPAGSEALPDDTPALDACVLAFWDLYTQARLTAAISLFRDFCAANHVPPGHFAARLAALKGLDLTALLDRAAAVDQGIRECTSDDGWRLVRDDDLRLLYRHTPGSTVHGLKGGCVLPAPLTHVLAMAREFDLVKTWNSYITASEVCCERCDVDVTVYAGAWLPWPLAQRDCFMEAVGEDRLDDAAALAVSFASPAAAPPPPLPSGYDARVHVGLQPGSCMLLTPLPPEPGGGGGGGGGGASRTRLVAVALVETGLAAVPDAVITFVLRTFAPFMYNAALRTLASAFRDADGPLPRRMRERPDLYQLFERRVEEFLRRQRQEEQQEQPAATAAAAGAAAGAATMRLLLHPA